MTTQNIKKKGYPATSRKWSIRGNDFVLLKFGFFWNMVKRGDTHE